MNKVVKIFYNSIPILVMIALIPFVKNDYVLACIYVVVIVVSFMIRIEKNEVLIFVAGFILMIISEYLFISTGVETFIDTSLFGLMPVWLPLLWGYGFVAIKRSSIILNK